MDLDSLKAKLEDLTRQRAKLAAELAKYQHALVQLDGSIGFCKGLIEEAEKAASHTDGGDN